MSKDAHETPTAPPSYEEVIAADVSLPGSTINQQYQSGAPIPMVPTQVAPQQMVPNHVPVNVPRLTFVDFLPRCIRSGNRVRKLQPSFEQFRTTCLLANQWLAAHPDCRLLSVEEVDRPIDWEGSYVLDKTISLHPAGDVNMVIRGLRLWLRARYPNDIDPPQQLDYFNFMPQYDHTGTGGVSVGMFGVTMSSPGRGEYFSLDNTIQMLNSQLAAKPLPGHMLSIRTVQLPLGKVDSLRQVQVSDGMAEETILNMAANCNTYFNYIRIYYIRGQPQQEQIEVGMVDFLPKMISCEAGKSPKFEPFSALTQHAGVWVQQNHGMGMKITNFQTIDHVLDMHYNVSSSSINSRKTCIHLTNSGPNAQKLHVKFLRVNYMRPCTVPVTPMLLSTRTVPPIQLGVKVAETEAETVSRINAWVEASGAHVIGVETVEEIYHDYTGRFDLDNSFYLSGNKSHHTIKAMRLFISGSYMEVVMTVKPHPRVEPVRIKPTRSSSTCAVM